VLTAPSVHPRLQEMRMRDAHPVGAFYVHVLSVANLPNVQSVGTQDPYVEVEIEPSSGVTC